MSRPQRSILSVGAATALAPGALSSALAARAGKLANRSFDLASDGSKRVGTTRARRIPDEVVGVERMLRFAVPALREAAAGLGLADGARVRVFCALPEPRPLPEEEEKRLGAGFFEALGRVSELDIDAHRSVAVRIGHAGFATALELALAASGDTPVLVGGVDSYHHPRVLEHLLESKRILSEDTHGGMVPSEGAAFLAVGSASQRPALATIAAQASGKELPKTWEEPRVAELLTDLVALSAAPLSARPLGWVLPDINGERHRAKEWDFCSVRCSDLISPPKTEITRLTESWGDTGAATGALAAVYVVLAWQTGFAPAPHALVTLASEGDERGVVALEAPT